ncbi:hypothetical protein CDES_12975 [Corynebacterium deserti GIMN1.010]|uniref:Phosphatidic acid phosphatase type 2/haloperoxidase domain-containing protein n=1 Tax=Corynebacterium deserti GIMN1.010 TaxID=931089 RepID=A0A0M3QA63_9CORY|nr:phosphatase PAP2 family protein [Corynebacterium deserti]ALC06939.1 hypothetical protein CDES_12975 [Corynebacterium deserti GIMN1.010]
MDQTILDAVIGLRAPWLTPLIVAFTKLTGPTFMLIYAAIFSVFNRKHFVPVIAGVGLANLTSHIWKKVIERPRPDAALHLVEETNFSMPSGHAVGATAFAVVIGLAIGMGAHKWWSLAVWILALLVGLSRLYVGVHWPSDVVIGWLLGAFVAGGVYYGVTTSSNRLRRH